MNKHTWNKVQLRNKNQNSPIPRWGHSCCVIEHQIVFFGGYADSNYMNDVHSFNTLNMEWTQVKTTGDIPANRSNCSMNYDYKNNRIIIFGGGGPNKKRFNSISILDWTTKQWTQINPKQNQAAPWQRTYHSAQLLYPYLIVFGGQGVSDLDDLWLFNFQTLSWRQVPIDKQKSKPCARRFHSSAIVGHQFFVIAGCHSKYKPLNDVYSLDLSILLKNGDINSLQWQQKKFKSSAFLTRWGQSSSVYENKIYIFGGRFSNDLNDVLIIDLQKQSMRTLKTGSNDVPKPRRRHCGCFVGSNLIVFGGFNGQYFNDLHYINVFEVKSKISQTFSIKSSNFIKNSFKYLNNPKYYDRIVQTIDNKKVYILKGLIRQHFSSNENMNRFLAQIDGNYLQREIIKIFQLFYQGFGSSIINKKIFEKYQIDLPSQEQQLNEKRLNKIYKSNNQIFKKSQTQPVVCLNQQRFQEYTQQLTQQSFKDITLEIHNYYRTSINSAKLIVSSKYFQSMLTSNFSQNYWNQRNTMQFEQKQEQKNLYLQRILQFDLPISNIMVFEIFQNYLNTGYVVIPDTFAVHNWMQLGEIAYYFCNEKLLKICQYQLIYKLNNSNLQIIFNFANEVSMKYLFDYCSQMYIKDCVNKQSCQMINQNGFKLNLDQFPEKSKPQINKVYQLLKFDVNQILLKKQKNLQLCKKDSCSTSSQKQNHQMNQNYC